MMVFGIENEYTAFNIDGRSRVPDYKRFCRDSGKLVLDFCENGRNPIFSNSSQGRVWLANGGKIYNDLEHVEYASPECETLEELVARERAGDFLILKAFGKEADEDNLFIMKRSSDTRPDEVDNIGNLLESTWGSHENFMVPDWLWQSLNNLQIVTPARLVLEAHLATRPIYTGAGQIRFFEESGEKNVPNFLLSPRAHYLFSRVNLSTTSNRPFINNREPDGVSDILRGDFAAGSRRLHLLTGDMNRSSWSVYLKIGTTILVLWYLILHGEDFKSGNLAQKVYLGVDPPFFIKSVSQALVKSGCLKYYEAALTVQRVLLEAVKKDLRAIGEYFTEAPKVVDLWEVALEEIRNPFAPVSADKIDWTIQKKIFEDYLGAEIKDLPRLSLSEDDLEGLESLAFSYSRINSSDLFSQGIKSGWIRDFFSKERVEEALLKPPQGRAERRVEIAKYAISRSLSPYVSNFDWSAIFFMKQNKQSTADKPYEVIIDSKPIEELKSNVDKIAKRLRQ